MWAINILQRQQIQGPFLVIILLKRNEWFKERLLALWVDFEGFDNIRSIDVSYPFMGLYDCWSPTFFDQLIAAPAAGIWGYDLPNLAKEQLHLSLRCVGILVQNRIHASKCVLCCDFAQTKRDFWGFKVGIVFWNEVEPESIASCYTSARSRLIGQLGHILAQAPLDTTDISTTILECGIGPSAIGNLSITLIWGYSIYIYIYPRIVVHGCQESAFDTLFVLKSSKLQGAWSSLRSWNYSMRIVLPNWCRHFRFCRVHRLGPLIFCCITASQCTVVLWLGKNICVTFHRVFRCPPSAQWSNFVRIVWVVHR